MSGVTVTQVISTDPTQYPYLYTHRVRITSNDISEYEEILNWLYSSNVRCTVIPSSARGDIVIYTTSKEATILLLRWS